MVDYNVYGYVTATETKLILVLDDTGELLLHDEGRGEDSCCSIVCRIGGE